MSLLDTLVAQTLTQYHQYEEQQKQKAEAARLEAEQEAEATLLHLLEEALTSEFRESVAFKLSHTYDTTRSYKRGNRTTTASFVYLDYDWRLTYNGATWQIRKAHDITWDDTFGNISTNVLQTRLLVEMGKHKEAVEAEAAKVARIRREDEIMRKERELRAQEEARERVARIHEANKEHARLLAHVEEEKAKATAALWSWPEGVTIEIYELEYCRGSYRTEDGDMSFDYAGGWTAVDHLDERGRIETLPHRYREARTVQLSMDVHCPTWTVHRISSVEDLPAKLKEEVTFSLPRVAWHRAFRDLDDKQRLIETEALEYGDFWYEESIGWQPLPWIRFLVESVDTLDSIGK